MDKGLTEPKPLQGDHVSSIRNPKEQSLEFQLEYKNGETEKLKAE